MNRSALLTVLFLGSSLLPACGSSGDDSKPKNSDVSKGGSSAGSPSGSSAGSDASGEPEGFACTEIAQPGEMVAVAAGEFTMGCDSRSCGGDEQPQHVVTLSAFEIDRTEVTQAQYTACIEDGACAAPSCDWSCDRPDLPAGCVTWAQANAFCGWAGKRLPTEAEWERAARGDAASVYPWGDDAPSCERANMAGCEGGLLPVGSAPSGASPFGALDMAGNVVEFVADWYDAGYYLTSPATDPKGPETGTRYSGRGGGFKSDSNFLRASKRDWYDPTDTAVSLGFRCAR
jgi:formylglycine-generating enzyme required for sulfatase activity